MKAQTIFEVNQTFTWLREPLFGRLRIEHVLRQAASLGTEEERITRQVVGPVVARPAARRQREPARGGDRVQEGLEVRMLMHLCELPVVQAGTAQTLVLEVETERVDQVQGAAGIGAQAYDVAGVGRDFRLVEDDVKQREVPGHDG